jgi:hypothetical protein
MADQTLTVGTFYGATIALTSATTLIGSSQVEMFKWTGFTLDPIETTHLASGGKTFVKGDIADWGEIEVATRYSTQVNYFSLLETISCDTLTVTFPKRATTCGGALASAAATLAYPVIYLGGTVDFANDKPISVTHKFRVTGKPTPVAAQV